MEVVRLACLDGKLRCPGGLVSWVPVRQRRELRVVGLVVHRSLECSERSVARGRLTFDSSGMSLRCLAQLVRPVYVRWAICGGQ